jgi:acetyltransferase EpsM
MRKVIILGAGGDGLVIAEAISQINKAADDSEKIVVQGFLDDAYTEKSAFEQFFVYGNIDSWKSMGEEVFFIPALQKVGDMPRRIARIEDLNIPMERWISVIHPSAVIASDIKLGAGVYIGAFCSIQPRCMIGNFSTLRAGAALGHDVSLSNHVYVGPNAVLCGKSSMQHGSHLGPGSVILDNCIVGEFAVVGVCSAVTKNVSNHAVVMGNPAKRINKFLKIKE